MFVKVRKLDVIFKFLGTKPRKRYRKIKPV